MERSVGAASYPKASSSHGRGTRGRGTGLCALLLALAACHTTPVTGRRSLNFYSTRDDVKLGTEAYQQVLAEAKLVTSGPKLEMVRRVMTRLAAVSDDKGFAWEVNLIQDDQTVNAFALPGGKMAVYTGILPVCQDETGLAVVMGHEIGHVVAQHGTERMTSTLGIDTVLSWVNIGDYAGLAQQGLDLLVNKPFGRSQESEADEIGLEYMARAGYDPREAVAFWERMEKLTGSSGPEFLSTHPSHETRVQHLKEKMPKALDTWRAAGGGGSR
jgi:metalloendopeptidase OMA1, mitochondrial